MAISDVKEYTHLSEEEVEQLGRELDAIRAEVEESRCDKDAEGSPNSLITPRSPELPLVDRERRDCDRRCVLRVGFPASVAMSDIAAGSLDGLVAFRDHEAGEDGAVAAGSLDSPEGSQVTSSEPPGPVDRPPHSRCAGGELLTPEQLTC